MDKKEQILHYHRIDGLSQREIARRVGVSRKTVKRYITEYETLAQADPEDGINMCLASEPKYPTRKIERTRLTEPVCAEIEYWLSENAKRRLTGMRKQCLKKQDIHRALIEKGFTISYSSVCKYIQQRKAEKSRKPKDVFVKQYYEPGEECEFDWGEVKLRIGGKPVTFTMAVFALCHSEGRWAYLFRHQDNLAFMESHRNFFHDVHGVPHTMVYDNMKVAVIRAKKNSTSSFYPSALLCSNYLPQKYLKPLVFHSCYKVLQNSFCYILFNLESPVHRHFSDCSM